MSRSFNDEGIENISQRRYRYDADCFSGGVICKSREKIKTKNGRNIH
jgi:hypothetical protein